MSKLVRDKIPVFIQATGKKVKFHVEDDKDKLYKRLLNKLQEEVTEVKKTTNDNEFIHEMADVYEVLLALLKFRGMTLSDMQETAKAKRDIRGAFDKHIILDKVEE